MLLFRRLLVAFTALTLISVSVPKAQAITSSGFNVPLQANFTAELYLNRYPGTYAEGLGKTTLNQFSWGQVNSEYVKVTVQKKQPNTSFANAGDSSSPSPCDKREWVLYTAQCKAYSQKITAAGGEYRATSDHAFYGNNGTYYALTTLTIPSAVINP